MLVLRFTQTLLKDMKVTPTEEDILPLFSWHANICKLNNRKHIILINDFSRLTVIIDGIRSSQINTLKDKFLSILADYLSSEGVKQSVVESYIKTGSEMTITKTNSRSVIGTMKEIIFYNSVSHIEFQDNIERMKWLNRLIYKPIDYHEPRNIFIEAIQNQYS
ncbi:hypothetical protein FE783_08295 [Paenibacillus mesophilus]|uniref:DUF6933 domain-containing protein n=1 Tax=Paenibacillus mesophilus TaxID=2582849 RepID=UPI00110EEA66|nr:hypothetical protein [Paenibacillus mesophilus]TMV50683.1 hypothetical protein FE783_08295 [Paenibacillus mesophilus]